MWYWNSHFLCRKLWIGCLAADQSTYEEICAFHFDQLDPLFKKSIVFALSYSDPKKPWCTVRTHPHGISNVLLCSWILRQPDRSRSALQTDRQTSFSVIADIAAHRAAPRCLLGRIKEEDLGYRLEGWNLCSVLWVVSGRLRRPWNPVTHPEMIPE